MRRHLQLTSCLSYLRTCINLKVLGLKNTKLSERRLSEQSFEHIHRMTRLEKLLLLDSDISLLGAKLIEETELRPYHSLPTVGIVTSPVCR